MQRRGAMLAGWLLVLAGMLTLATLWAQRPLPLQLQPPLDSASPDAVFDRQGQVLRAVHDGGWNTAQQVPLTAVPLFLREAMVTAEDRRYWTHGGVDWSARLAALVQNLKARRAVRGASTITEQVVRLLHPRPRTVWSRWVEGFEAWRLERRYSKAEVLTFYLNQLPYGAQRRGVVAAAEHYFGRSLETLDRAEMLALAVLPRAPSRLRREPSALRAAMARLAAAMDVPAESGQLSWQPAAASPQAAHFVREVTRRARALGQASGMPVISSLDGGLQAAVEAMLIDRLAGLRDLGVRQAAALVVDVADNRVRAWASVDAEQPEVVGIDAVRTPRQPGSTLKPFVYAQAFERGWGAGTTIEDAKLTEWVNAGLHEVRNYSRTHYGAVTVREALGNSLNIPAVKALQFVEPAAMLDWLHRVGVSSLDRPAVYYGDGLALGNGELSLYELVQAYTVLARQGRWRALTVFEDERESRPEQVVLSVASAEAINAILSDPASRLLEFGDGGVLRFPQRTAVKTGTSSDYRDAWTVAYTGSHVVGVWLGNLSAQATDGLTGARGPALLARSILARIEPQRQVLPVPERDQTQPATIVAASSSVDGPRLRQPYEGLQLAMDPRIPDAMEAFGFELEGVREDATVRWWVDGELQAEAVGGRWLWPLSAGTHTATVQLRDDEGGWTRLPSVRFTVR